MLALAGFLKMQRKVLTPIDCLIVYLNVVARMRDDVRC